MTPTIPAPVPKTLLARSYASLLAETRAEGMTNDEARMTKECLMTNPKQPKCSGFDIRYSSFFRHSSFDIRHWKCIRLSVLVCLLHCLLASSANVAQAAEPRWQDDYNAARTEAQKTGKPLLLYFFADSCPPCKKLEATTFKDEIVLTLMSEQFVAVKLNGHRETRLVEALKVRGYPTLILVGPEGRILKTVEGYVDAERFRDHLQEALAALANPEWMVRAYQDAARAQALGNSLQAVALLKNVLEDQQTRPIQQQARRLLADIEQQAQAKLGKARQVQDQGQHLEAMDQLSRLMRDYAGTQAAADAGDVLSVLADKPEVKATQRRRRAAEVLAQARSDFAAGQYVCCLERCEWLAAHYPDFPEGGEAVLLLEQIKGNPEWMGQIAKTLTERLGDTYLSLAECWIGKGQPQLAVECLEQLMAQLPYSRHAELARRRLAQIQGRPALHADFKSKKSPLSVVRSP